MNPTAKVILSMVGAALLGAVAGFTMGVKITVAHAVRQGAAYYAIDDEGNRSVEWGPKPAK